jgi:hypothetical protein
LRPIDANSKSRRLNARKLAPQSAKRRLALGQIADDRILAVLRADDFAT